MLYIVSTPIGNIRDITLRAIDILRESDLILAEDTRRTLNLLKKYEIRNQLDSFNDFNKEKKTSRIIGLLKQGKDIALVSDSGTPGISDPGFYLVRECVKNDIGIAPVPGPSAAIAALSCSGLPTDSFVFYGFIPKKEGKKKRFFEDLKKEDKTIILYESPHRINKTLKTISETLPESDVVIARELTKKFEEFIRGKASDVYAKLKDKELKGEIVILINNTAVA